MRTCARARTSMPTRIFTLVEQARERLQGIQVGVGRGWIWIHLSGVSRAAQKKYSEGVVVWTIVVSLLLVVSA